MADIAAKLASDFVAAQGSACILLVAYDASRQCFVMIDGVDARESVSSFDLAPRVNRPLQAQLVRPQRRKWHKSLALERPISCPKGATYRHDPDVDWQRADSIKFAFSATTPSCSPHKQNLNFTRIISRVPRPADNL
jgi:hypothetical protein